MWSELFKLLLKQLSLVVGDGLFVKDQDLGNVVVVYLVDKSLAKLFSFSFLFGAHVASTHLFLEVLEHLVAFSFDRV